MPGAIRSMSSRGKDLRPQRELALSEIGSRSQNIHSGEKTGFTGRIEGNGWHHEKVVTGKRLCSHK